jgi:hypothetical protein
MRVKRGQSRGQVVRLREEFTKKHDSVEAAARLELEELDLADTMLGRAVLVLAARVDVGNETGAAMAAVVKQLASTMDQVKAGVPRPASPVDQLRQKRLERMGLTSDA